MKKIIKEYRDADFCFIDKSGQEYISSPEIDCFLEFAIISLFVQTIILIVIVIRS